MCHFEEESMATQGTEDVQVNNLSKEATVQENGTPDSQTSVSENTSTITPKMNVLLDDSNEESVSEWLLSLGLAKESCFKLISNGYNTMSIFEICNENDIDSISDEFNLKNIEKLRLKSGINKLLELRTDKLQMIDPKERNAMIKMQEEIALLEDSMNAIDITLIDIDQQKEICLKLIDKRFNKINIEIEKRKKSLICKLERMVNVKKKILSTQNNKILKKLKLSQKIKNDAHKLLNDSQRKGNIFALEKEILELENIYNKPNVSACLIFDFESDYYHLLHTINTFGNITNDSNDEIKKKEKGKDVENDVVEHWDHETIGDNMKVSINGKKGRAKTIVLCLEKQSYSYRSCFGINTFDQGTHHWQLMIKQCNGGYCAWNMLIGVMKIDNKQNQQSIYRYNKQTKLYHRNSHFTSNGYGFVGNLAFLTSGSDQDRSYGSKFSNVGDIIDVYLDLNKRTLSYKINGIGYGVAYTELQDTKYCLAVSFCGAPNELELLNYDNDTYK